MKMNLSVKDRKILWAKAGNHCSYRFGTDICDHSLVKEDAGGQNVVIGVECHIVGEKPSSARYSDNCPTRESYDNAILLCSIHHKMVDDNPVVYSVATLQQMKREHEDAVSAGSREQLDFRDSEFITEVSDADRAVGMEVNKPASFSNVTSTLKATNVKEAIGFSTNQGLVGMISSCPQCHKPVPSAHTGATTSDCVLCPYCGARVR